MKKIVLIMLMVLPLLAGAQTKIKETAVPLRLPQKKIGEAFVAAARTRAKYIGGERAVYDPDLL